MTTRWLRDDHDLYYDAGDMFSTAVDGGRWTDRWHVADDSVEVGDVFYLVWPGDSTVQARAVAVAAELDDRPDQPDLGPAYCSDLTDLELDDGPAMCVRIEFESIAEPDQELSVADLDLDLDDVESADVIDEALAADLATRWDTHVDRLLATKQSVRLPVG
jgi:hypothetical protein